MTRKAPRGIPGGIQPPTLQTIPAAIAANVALVRARTRGRVMAVVKADGYGHGAAAVARAAVDAGADWLGVTAVSEAIALRRYGFTVPILAWLHPSGIDAASAARESVDVALGSVEEMCHLLVDTAGTPVRVHLNLDTGMARGGAPRAEWDDLLRLAVHGARRGKLRVVGLMGHLPRADHGDPDENAPAVRLMQRARALARNAGLGVLPVHLAASAAALTDPATHFDMVRVGAALVGIDPAGRTPLQGAGRFTASVVHTAWAAAGTPVGYGGTHVTERPAHLSILGVGYADGIPRELSPAASVEIDGRRHRIVGRVSMDQIVVDTGSAGFARGTPAVVFGPGGGSTPSIHEWAGWADTIAHTIVTGIGARVTRSIA